jgi:hypothetical protein
VTSLVETRGALGSVGVYSASWSLRRSRYVTDSSLAGAPGIGRSTLAGRYVADHPGVLNCDIDVLRTLIGGWGADFAEAWARRRQGIRGTTRCGPSWRRTAGTTRPHAVVISSADGAVEETYRALVASLSATPT